MNVTKYSAAEKKIFARQALKEKEYWQKKLSGELLKCSFPADYSGFRNRSEFKNYDFKIAGDIHLPLMELSNGSDARLHMILVAVITVLLSKYCDHKDIIIGTSIDKLEHEGEFVNTVLALRNCITDGISFKELLLQVRTTINEAIENQNYPIESILNDLDMPLNDEDFPLFDVAVLLENIQDRKYLSQLKLNLIFSFLRSDEGLTGQVEYNALCYKSETIESIVSHLDRLFRRVLLDVDLKISELTTLSEHERKQVLFEFNRPALDFPLQVTIPQEFEAQVHKTPDQVAVVFEDQSMTYSELSQQASRLAHLLQTRGVTSNCIVAIMVERSIEMIVAMLAVLKAGAAYLPLDYRTPLSRNLFIMEDSQAEIVITQPHLIDPAQEELAREFWDKVVLMDAQTNGTNHHLTPSNNAGDIAYVIFTSGTTGKPKGVMIEHRNVINFVHDLNESVYKKYGGPLNLGLVSSFIFDASVQLTFSALLFGHVLYIVNERDRADGFKLMELCDKNNIDILDGTPTHLNLLLQALAESNGLRRAKHIIIGGDVLSQPKVKNFLNQVDNEIITISNVYGPTECTVNTTSFEINKQSIDALDDLPIGRSISNCRVFVIDRDRNLAPIGAPGELCVSGAGVARGYLNRVELTAEKFVLHPFVDDEKVYRTGDIVKWRTDGNLMFLGRNDNQIKLRGYRIELGEIENLLHQHEQIHEAVVVAREDADGHKYICAYVVAGNKILVSELREYLLRELPEHAVPSYFVSMEKLPMTPTGKIDRKSLPEPIGIMSREVEYVPPRDGLEAMLADIWKTELRLEKVGIKDNYFNIGGDSIKSISLINVMSQQFNRKFKIVELYQNATIEKFAKIVNKIESDASQDYQKAAAEVEAIKHKFLNMDQTYEQPIVRS